MMGMSPTVTGPSRGGGRSHLRPHPLRAPYPHPWQHCHTRLAALCHSASAPAGLDNSPAPQGRPSVSHTRETIGNNGFLVTLPCRAARSVEGDRISSEGQSPCPGEGLHPSVASSAPPLGVPTGCPLLVASQHWWGDQVGVVGLGLLPYSEPHKGLESVSWTEGMACTETVRWEHCFRVCMYPQTPVSMPTPLCDGVWGRTLGR